MPRCENCGNPFTPRKGKGGMPQRFCKAACQENAYRRRRYARHFSSPKAQPVFVAGPASWEEAIADAEIRIHNLRVAIAMFKRHQLAGDIWPGEFGPI